MINAAEDYSAGNYLLVERGKDTFGAGKKK